MKHCIRVKTNGKNINGNKMYTNTYIHIYTTYSCMELTISGLFYLLSSTAKALMVKGKTKQHPFQDKLLKSQSLEQIWLLSTPIVSSFWCIHILCMHAVEPLSNDTLHEGHSGTYVLPYKGLLLRHHKWTTLCSANTVLSSEEWNKLCIVDRIAAPNVYCIEEVPLYACTYIRICT